MKVGEGSDWRAVRNVRNAIERSAGRRNRAERSDFGAERIAGTADNGELGGRTGRIAVYWLQWK